MYSGEQDNYNSSSSSSSSSKKAAATHVEGGLVGKDLEEEGLLQSNSSE